MKKQENCFLILLLFSGPPQLLHVPQGDARVVVHAAAAAHPAAPHGRARGRVAVAPLRDATQHALPHAQALLLQRQDVAGAVRVLQGRALHKEDIQHRRQGALHTG